MDRVSELRRAVQSDSTGPEAFELASLLSEQDQKARSEAREICFQAITDNPSNHRMRLLLARLFYLDRMGEFCVRELVELQRRKDVPALRRLLDSFGELGKAYRANEPHHVSSPLPEGEDGSGDTDDILAEVDLDAAFVDILDDVEEK